MYFALMEVPYRAYLECAVDMDGDGRDKGGDDTVLRTSSALLPHC